LSKFKFKPVVTSSDKGDINISKTWIVNSDHDTITHQIVNATAEIQESENGEQNQLPTAKITVSSQYEAINTIIDFNASQSTDPDGTIDKYHWDFGDGSTVDTKQAKHSYKKTGQHTVTLTVTDNKQAQNQDQINITITRPNNPPTKPAINGPNTGHKNTEYTFNITSTDADEDPIKYTILWGDGSQENTIFLKNNTNIEKKHQWNQPGHYTIKITAYDNITQSPQKQHEILIDSHKIENIGYLIDENEDGTYDLFQNINENISKTNVDQIEKQYLIDTDADQKWDYKYNLNQQKLTEYQTDTTNEENNDLLLYLGIAFLIIITIIILSAVYIKRK
ncbi:MAG: PKD domain-containing protein, partial [Candidatus Thermoplasmatota archaeon]